MHLYHQSHFWSEKVAYLSYAKEAVMMAME